MPCISRPDRRLTARLLLLATVLFLTWAGTAAAAALDSSKNSKAAATLKPAAQEQGLTEGPRKLPGSESGIGRLIPDLEVQPFDRSGKAFHLSDPKKPKSAIVIAFTSTSCPVANRYASTLAALEKQYGGVRFIFVNPIASDSEGDIKKAIRTHGFRGSYVHDTKGQLAAALGARATTEVFVLDAARTLIYRGAIDDQYA